MTSVLLLGSSHTNKFEAFIAKKSSENPFCLECPRTVVLFHGISEGRITKLYHVPEMEDHVRLIQPTRIYMQIGGNDLDSVDISSEYTTFIVKKIFLCVGGFLQNTVSKML